MRRYDFKNHQCSQCQTLMNYEYFKKYHTTSECFKDEFFKKEHDKELEESWQMILKRRKECKSAPCVEQK